MKVEEEGMRGGEGRGRGGEGGGGRVKGIAPHYCMDALNVQSSRSISSPGKMPHSSIEFLTGGSAGTRFTCTHAIVHLSWDASRMTSKVVIPLDALVKFS